MAVTYHIRGGSKLSLGLGGNVMFKYICITLPMALLYIQLFSQNMVENNSFENFMFCPKSYSHYKKSLEKCLVNWYSPTKGTPDYYNSCNKYGVGVPKNSIGYSEPKSGQGYVGFILVNDPNTIWAKHTFLREYIATELKEPLLPGRLYCFTMHISLSDYSRYVTDEIGVYFSEKKPDKRTNLNLSYAPQIVFNEMMLENDTSWVELKAVYKATGGETYITIGNFETQKEVNWKERDLQHIRNDKIVDYAYYYIDDVSLTPVENTPIKEKDFTY